MIVYGGNPIQNRDPQYAATVDHPEGCSCSVSRRLGLPAGDRVLDAPCGEGALAAALGRAGLEAYGADMEASARAIARPALLARRPEPGRCPGPTATFDAVFSIEGIEHLENRYLFLREAQRILRPGGVLVVTTPNIVVPAFAHAVSSAAASIIGTRAR